MSRRTAAAMNTGRPNVAYRRKRDAGTAATLRAVARARPVNVAGAQAIARRTVRRAMDNAMEDKYWSKSVLAQSILDNSTAWQPSNECAVPQSSTAGNDGTRVGDQITLKSYEFRMTWSAGTLPGTLRVVIFQWKDLATASLPGRQQVLFSALDVTGGLTTPPNWDYTQDNIRKGNLRILADYRIPFNPATGSNIANGCVFFKTKKMAKTVTYSQGANYPRNGIFVWMGTDLPSGGATSTKPSIGYQSKIVFEDA